jgi:hypothetical protein
MIQIVKEPFDVSLDEPLGPDPGLLDLDQGCMAASAWPEAVGEG